MRPNAWVGLVAIVLGVVYTLQAIALPRASIGDPMAPIYFPLGIGILTALVGALVFVLEAKKGLNNDDKSKRPQFHLQSMKLIFYVIILCLVYTYLFDHIGFVFATLIFLIAALMIINPGMNKLRQNILITLIFTFGMWYIFVQLFQISLPASPWGYF